MNFLDPAMYNESMTLLVGWKCDDGTILASDSRATNADGTVKDDVKKVFKHGGVAVGIAGRDMPLRTSVALEAFMENIILKHTNYGAESVAYELRSRLYPYLALASTEIQLLVADKDSLWSVNVRSGSVEPAPHAISEVVGGISIEYEKSTLSDLNRSIVRAIKGCKDPKVGGRPQVVKLPK